MGVTIASDMGADIFSGQPENIGLVSIGVNVGSRTGDQSEHQQGQAMS